MWIFTELVQFLVMYVCVYQTVKCCSWRVVSVTLRYFSLWLSDPCSRSPLCTPLTFLSIHSWWCRLIQRSSEAPKVKECIQSKKAQRNIRHKKQLDNLDEVFFTTVCCCDRQVPFISVMLNGIDFLFLWESVPASVKLDPQVWDERIRGPQWRWCPLC